jgi:hypothetical protein
MNQNLSRAAKDAAEVVEAEAAGEAGAEELPQEREAG